MLTTIEQISIAAICQSSGRKFGCLGQTRGSEHIVIAIVTQCNSRENQFVFIVIDNSIFIYPFTCYRICILT